MSIIKKILLKCLIGTLIISALFGIVIIVFDLWNDVTSKVLFTAISVFLFSVPGLCSSTIYETKYRPFSIVGILIALAGCIYMIVSICGFSLENIFDDLSWRIFGSLVILTAYCAHMSLILLINNGNKIVKYFRLATLVLISIFDGMLLYMVNIDDLFSGKIVVVTLILAALGTIVTPILNKVYKKV